ncbi:MAG: NAD(+) synthase [Lachnospiraceae bacterium]|nr:NAD(+) synthase [Lachnospiraceae bacterium]
MFHGFVKTAAATPKLIVGDVDYNVSEIIDQMCEAADAGVRILVFPELCITGATCGDLFRQERLIEAAKYGLQDIVDASADLDMLIFVGLPWEKDGKLYNVTAAVKSGTLLGLVPKLVTDTDDAVSEARWFESGAEIPELIDPGIFSGGASWPDEDEDEDDDDVLRFSDGEYDPDEGMELSIEEDEDTDDDDAVEVIGVIEPGDDEDGDDPLGYDPEFFEDWDDDEEDEPFGAGIDEQPAVPFGSNIIFECTDFPGLKVAVEMGEERKMIFSPAAGHVSAGAVIIVNPCAVRMEAGKMKETENDLRAESGRLSCAYVRASAGPDESTTDAVFSGSRVIAECGTVLASGKPMKTGITVTDIDFTGIGIRRRDSRYFIQADEQETAEDYVFAGFCYDDLSEAVPDRRISADPYLPASGKKSVCREILDMQAAALSKRMRHTGSQRLVLGLSGGLDSALAAIVSVKAAEAAGFGAEAVLCLSMPAFGTTGRTHDNSAKLAGALGCEHREIPIADSLLQHFKDIGHPVDLHDAAYENAQARERTQILMDLANMEKGLVVGTGDMSEDALGWCTYNGDQMAMYNVNADIPKTVIREIVGAFADSSENKELAAVLRDILDTPVSPELLPAEADGSIAQKTEDILGPYELHDFFLFYMLKYGYGPEKISWLAEQAFAGRYDMDEILNRLEIFYRRFFASQFKRSCAPDGPQIFGFAISPRGGLVMPSDASGMAWIQDVEILKRLREMDG